MNNWIRLQIKIQDDCPLDYTTAKTFAKAFEAALMKFTSVEQVVLEDWLPRKEQEKREDKIVDLIHDALAEFCPDQCDWGHQVDVARYIGEGDIENWLKKRKVENAADNC